jgi:hypothetical protein
MENSFYVPCSEVLLGHEAAWKETGHEIAISVIAHLR